MLIVVRICESIFLLQRRGEDRKAISPNGMLKSCPHLPTSVLEGMTMTRDAELLSLFVRDHSQAAFSELVSRHINAVYASARRQARDPGLAEDVTQAVFLMLAKKATSLKEDVLL